MSRVFPKVSLGLAERAYLSMCELVNDQTALLDQPITVEVLQDLTVKVMQGFEAAGFGFGNQLNRDAIFQSLSHLVGRSVRLSQLHVTLKRISRNRDALIHGQGDYVRGISPWQGHLPALQWTCLRFIELVEQDHVVTFMLEVDWGPIAPQRVYKAVQANHESLFSMMYKAGLGRKHSGSPRELIGLHIWAELTYREGVLTFSRYALDEAIKARNKKLIYERRKPCPPHQGGYTWLCCQCPVGHEMCRRATRLCPVPTAGVPLSFKEQRYGIDLTDESAGQRGVEQVHGRPDAVDEPGPGHSPQLSGSTQASAGDSGHA